MMAPGDWFCRCSTGKLMTKTVLAVAIALLLAGGAASTASAKSHHSNNNGGHRHSHRHHGSHHYAHNNRGVRSPDHWDRSVVHDSDHDGIANHDDNYDNRWDKARFRYDRSHVYYAVTPYSGPRYVEPVGYRYNRWQAGASLPRGYYGDPYYVNYQTYNLPSPPSGYRWNRVGNDVYLVETTNGLISEVVYSLFH
jgi:Ni/Co efflux regulator RcnB